MPNLNWITSKYFPQHSPRSINSGNCYNWAYIAYQHYNAVSLYTVQDCGGHAFIKIRQKYFDSQNPNGVLHWSSLQSLREICHNNIYYLRPYKHNINAFLRYWAKNGRFSIINIEE